MNDSDERGVRHLVVDAELDGQRIDNFLMRMLKGAPRPLIYRILRRGEVRVNRGRIKQGYRLRGGDVVRVPPLRLAPPAHGGQPARVPGWLTSALTQAVLFEDEGLLVLNKPSGVAVHGGSGESLGIIEAMRVLRPDVRSLELVHRLDKDTSGCLLLAKRRSALRRAHEALRERRVDKQYLALLRGRWPRAQRLVDAALRKNVLQSGERVVRAAPDGKPSRTAFEVLDSSDECTLVVARPVTGRTHQIRVHAQIAGHPIAGDPKYGDAPFNASLRALGLERLFLHASVLRVPALGVDAHAPLDDALRGVLRRLGLPVDGHA